MKRSKHLRAGGFAAIFRSWPAGVITMLCVSACSEATEHMLNPAGPAAERIERIWWEMFVVYGIVYLITLALLFFALIARRRKASPLGTRFVFVAGIAIPTLILLIMLAIAIHDTMELGKGEADFRVRVVSHHWWFAVYYPDLGIVDANEINIPAGVSTQFELQSHEVVHSFWVPRLGGKRDMLPDHPTYLTYKADQAGDFRGTCTEYCAGPHAQMAFRLIAREPQDFERWAAQSRQPPPEPSEPQLIRGREVFVQEGCIACHAIRGISEANAGPDLTLLGSRRTLGAGTIAHTAGSLAGWIANPQEIKPGNLMPRSYLAPDDLHALTAYLRSLP
jgi:cytochrome c oxidase subunit II